MTYSIVAREHATGRFGLAVQSHWFDVGRLVPWASPGVGAVATQSLVEVSYGPLGLQLLRGGHSAVRTLDALRAADEGRDLRQVAIIDAAGGVAVHTGARCIGRAGDRTETLADGTVLSAQANMMRHDGVPEAMVAAFVAAEADELADRLLAALRAAEAHGGDIRGRQSAALVVTAPASTGKPWEDRELSLSVPDHAAPLDELARLLGVQRAYERMNAGDAAMERDDPDAALAEFGAALEAGGGRAEMEFWTGVALLNAGREADAQAYLDRAFADGSGEWRELLRRLPASGLLPDDADLLARLSR